MHPLLQLLIRGMGFGLLVIAVSELAARYPRVGRLILTFPIVIPVVFLMMYLRDRELAPIARLSRETLMLIPLALVFFVPLAFAHRLQLSFWTAFASGLVLVTLAFSLFLWLAPRNL